MLKTKLYKSIFYLNKLKHWKFSIYKSVRKELHFLVSYYRNHKIKKKLLPSIYLYQVFKTFKFFYFQSLSYVLKISINARQKNEYLKIFNFSIKLLNTYTLKYIYL